MSSQGSTPAQPPLEALAVLMAAAPEEAARKRRARKGKTKPSLSSPPMLPGLDEAGPPQGRVPADPVAFLEAALGRKLRADQRRYLEGPAVFYGAWADDVPAWLLAAIPKARVVQVVWETAEEVSEYGWMCSLEETVAYLYSACMAVPLASEWAHVYFWASDSVMRAHGRLPEGQTVWDLIGADGSRDVDRGDISDFERGECLDKLRRDIRRAVVKHQKQRERAARRAAPHK